MEMSPGSGRAIYRKDLDERGHSGSSRVLRGASWNNNNENNRRCENRNNNDPTNRNHNIGFRGVLFR